MNEIPRVFTCAAGPLADGAIVRAAGEVDLATAAQVADELERVAARGPRRIVLDLSEVTFMDCSGLRMLLAADATARRRGYRLQIARSRGHVQRTFELAGVTEHLDFVEAAAD